MAAPTPLVSLPGVPYETLPYARRRWLPGGGAPDVGIALLGFAVVSAAAAVVVVDPRLGPKVAFLLAGVAGLVGLVALGLTRFTDFLFFLFVGRTAIDYFKPQQAAGLLEPPAVVGALALALGLAWLWQRQRHGQLVEVSRVGLALIGLSALTFVNPLFAAGRIESLQSAIRILSFTVLYVVLEQIFRTDPSQRRRLLRAIMWSLIIPAATALLQLVRDEGNAQYLEVGRVRGTFFHPNPFGTYLVMVVLIGYVLAFTGSHRVRPVYLIGSVTAFSFLIFTYARAAWIAALAGAIVLGLRLDRRIIKVLLLGVVFVVVAVPSVYTRLADLDDKQEVGAGDPNSLAWRVGYWEDLVPLGFEAPVGGIGLESTALIREEGLPPHNVFVQSFVELGLPGLILLFVVIIAIVNEVHRADYWARDGWERALAAVAAAIGIGFFLQLFSENILTQPVSLWYLAVVLAAAIANGWDAGVSPMTVRGELSIRQRLSMFLDEHRRDPSVPPTYLEGVDLRARVAEILARNARRAEAIALRARVKAILERNADRDRDQGGDGTTGSAP